MATLDGSTYVDPNTPPDPAQPQPTQTTLFHGGLTLDHVDPSGKKVYRSGDGGFYTDDPDPNSVSGFVPYTATVHEDPTAPPPPTGPAPASTTSGTTSPFPSGQPAPTFTPPPVTKPPAFSYADFVAPNPNDLNSDPAYQYTLRTEQDRIQKSAAARGVLNTGGTINDLLGNAADIAGAGYHDLFNRAQQSYGMNRGNAAENYRTNYDSQFVDPYKFNYQGLQDQYNAGQHNFDMGNQYAWYGRLFDQQKLNDQFNHRFSIYSTL